MLPSRLGKVHSMHCKILLKYYGKYSIWTTEILGLAISPDHAVMWVPWLSREQLCMFVLYCNEWDRIIAEEHAGQSYPLKGDYIVYTYRCITCLGNLCKIGDTMLCLAKRHQSCPLDWSSLVLLLWEVRMVGNEVQDTAPLLFCAEYCLK